MNNIEAEKIKIAVTKETISITDRMPFNRKEVLLITLGSFVFCIAALRLIGLVFAPLFSLGYIAFRYSAWVFWKEIKVDLEGKVLTVKNMFLDNQLNQRLVTDKFEWENFTLKEFEMRGKRRAMIQYKAHQVQDLLVLTTDGDIELLKKEVFNKV